MCQRPNVPRSDAKDLGELEKPLRDRIWTAMQHSPRKSAGGPTGLALVSGYRDPGRQWDLRHERVPHGQECNPKVKAYPATAVPYASDHGRRKAADIGGVDLMWLYRNCRAFGLWHNVSTENWHYVVQGNPTVKIIEYPGPAYDNAGPIAPPVVPAPPIEGALTVGQYEDLKAEIAANAMKQYAADQRRDDRIDKLERDHKAGAAGDRMFAAWVKSKLGKK